MSANQPPRPQKPADRIIAALDVPDVDRARALVEKTRHVVSFYKIGMQLQFAGGLDFAGDLVEQNLKVFLDVKLLDIDNTVEKGVENIAAMGVTFATIHAYPNAMRAAVRGRGAAPLGLLAVTVLTSMDDADLKAAGYGGTAEDLVEQRAIDAEAAGMTGIVCSAREVGRLRNVLRPETLLVTPGIRPAGSDLGDQRRVMSPGDAVRAGSDYLVIGRPIAAAADPGAAAEAIAAEIAAAG
ncbi:MAG: orotidine-5'-phosphate decarboxylase [Pseudomonadota bacterium]